VLTAIRSNEVESLKFNNVYTFIYVDALPLKYINEYNTPFLASLAKDGKTFVLQNIPGYSFGIQSTMLSGKLPQETKHWMPYIYIPEPSEKHNRLSIYHNPFLQTIFREHRYLPKPLRYVYQYSLCSPVFGTFRMNTAKLCGMPIEYLDDFYIYPYYYMNENPFFLEFKRLCEDKYGVNVYYFGHSLRRVQKDLVEFLKNISITVDNTTQDTMFFIYLDDLDGVGHKLGVSTEQWFKTLRIIDMSLFYLYKLLSKLTRMVYFVVFSDHGVCTADEYIDLDSMFRRYDVKDKILYFIDATLAFIWINNYRYKELIMKLLDKKLRNKAKIFDIETDKEVLKHYGVYFRNREYGDVVVQTKPCKEFFPNFYSITTPLKGLHGFWPDEVVQQAFIITPHKNRDLETYKPRHIKDIREYLLSLVNLT